MSRSAHHRTQNRVGPHHTWASRKALHIARAVVRPIRCLDALIREVDRARLPVNSVVLLQAREVRDIAWDYVTDETGEVWS